jgi:hypothetical protein
MKERLVIFGLFIILFLQGCYPSISNTITENLTTSTYTIKRTFTPSKTLRNTPTLTDTGTRTKYYTAFATVDISNVPSRIIGAGDKNFGGFSTNDIVYLINMLKKSAKDRDPYQLLDFMIFPMHKLGRCPGDVIETPSEFINRFSEFMTESTRTNILNFDWDDVWPKWSGLGIAINYRYDIWFTAYCTNDDCIPPHHIVAESFLGYGPYWDLVEGHPTPEPTYDPKMVDLGEYTVTSDYYNFISGGNLTRLDDTQSQWKNFQLTFTETSINMGPFISTDKDFPEYTSTYESCYYNSLEVCPPSDDYRGPYAGGYSLVDLHFICNNSKTYYIAILANDRLGFPIWPSHNYGYLILEHVKIQ